MNLSEILNSRLDQIWAKAQIFWHLVRFFFQDFKFGLFPGNLYSVQIDGASTLSCCNFIRLHYELIIFLDVVDRELQIETVSLRSQKSRTVYQTHFYFPSNKQNDRIPKKDGRIKFVITSFDT